MPIGNQKFGIPRKYQYQIGIWYFCPKVLGIVLVFERHIEYDLLKLWFNIGISPPPSHPCDGLAESLAGQVLSTKRLFYKLKSATESMPNSRSEFPVLTKTPGIDSNTRLQIPLQSAGWDAIPPMLG